MNTIRNQKMRIHLDRAYYLASRDGRQVGRMVNGIFVAAEFLTEKQAREYAEANGIALCKTIKRD